MQNIPQTSLVLTRGALTDATKIILDWELLDSEYESGYASVTGYRVYWEVAGLMELRVVLSNPFLTSYTETGVIQGNDYTFQISAINMHGEGPISDPLNVIPARVPDAPTDI